LAFNALKLWRVASQEYVAAKTSAQIIGSESTANLALISGIKEDKIIPVKGGEDYDFETFSVRVIPSLHTPLNNRHLLDTRMCFNRSPARQPTQSLSTIHRRT
jgi:hypothetical protein